jgi:hypothetical protein
MEHPAHRQVIGELGPAGEQRRILDPGQILPDIARLSDGKIRKKVDAPPSP